MKKIIIGIMAPMILIGTTVQTVGASMVSHNDIVENKVKSYEEKVIQEYEHDIDFSKDNFGLPEEVLNKLRHESSDYKENPTDENTENTNDGLIQPYGVLVTVGAVVGIIAGSVSIVKGLYQLGRYSARQAEKRLGLTTKTYKANRWKYRAGIGATFGVTVALGFDDYFYGV